MLIITISKSVTGYALGQSQVDTVTCQIRDHGLLEELCRVEALVVRDLEEWELHEDIYWKSIRLLALGK